MASTSTDNAKRKAEDTGSREAKKLKSSYTDIVKVVVGTEKKTFFVHQDVICTHSLFFKAACSGKWTEARDKIVNVPEQEPMIFTIYAEWAYSQSADLLGLVREVVVPTGSLPPSLAVHPFRRRKLTEALCDLWLFGDYLGDNSFKNKIIFTLIRGATLTSYISITYKTLEAVIEKSRRGSQLVNLLADFTLGDIRASSLKSHSHLYSKDVLSKWLERLLEKNSESSRVEVAQAGNYYEHE